jgi:Arc/MetJ-type ribon-helix-helix transcriptional regulator
LKLEIRNPELVERVNAHIQTGQFHDADELLEKALDALDERMALRSSHATVPITTKREFRSSIRGKRKSRPFLSA